MTGSDGDQAAARRPDVITAFEERRPLTIGRASLLVSVVTLTVTVLGGVAAWVFDSDGFPSLDLALWWALQTVTTVGYGDVVPRNSVGRLIGSVVMLAGIGFATVITATITSAFVQSARRRRGMDHESEILREVQALHARLDAMGAPPGPPMPPVPEPGPPAA